MNTTTRSAKRIVARCHLPGSQGLDQTARVSEARPRRRRPHLQRAAGHLGQPEEVQHVQAAVEHPARASAASAPPAGRPSEAVPGGTWLQPPGAAHFRVARALALAVSRRARLYTHSTAGESPLATLGCAISLPLVRQKSTDMAARAHRARWHAQTPQMLCRCCRRLLRFMPCRPAQHACAPDRELLQLC
jgi:hypothetical protein